ncbi:MAG: type III-A CRISPR-associated RAMP protein Csm3, partial [Deltaproteobacteria bacterium]
NIVIRGRISCRSGLHIGGPAEAFRIGGVDHPIVRDPRTAQPYIPGSTLKGRLRSLLEWALPNRLRSDGDVYVGSRKGCEISRIFGSSAVRSRGSEEPSRSGPGRLVVRDAFPETPVTVIETHTETRLNRITAFPDPRSMERVPRGTRFLVTLLYGVYDDQGDKGYTDIEHLAHLFTAFRLLEHASLGAGGSRGSGEVGIEIAEQPIIRTLESYQGAGGVEEEAPLWVPVATFSPTLYQKAIARVLLPDQPFPRMGRGSRGGGRRERRAARGVRHSAEGASAAEGRVPSAKREEESSEAAVSAAPSAPGVGEDSRSSPGVSEEPLPEGTPSQDLEKGERPEGGSAAGEGGDDAEDSE